MRTRPLIIGVSLLTALLVSSCTKTTPTGGGTTTKTSTIFGFVERSDDLSRVPNVVVYDVKGTAPSDTTKSDGSFKLTYQLTANYTGTLIASRTTFGNDTITFTLPAGANDTLPRILIIKADSTSQKTAASSGKVASIVLVAGGDVSSIAIRGTGFTESTPLTFEARDSLGVPVGGVNKATVFFSLLGGPGGGEYVFPVSAVTDLSGRAVTRVTSGSKPGVLQVYAFAKPDTSNPNYIVTSSPVRITISGGLPDSAHFSLSVQKQNIAGMLFDNLRDDIKVIIGDKNGNPVQIGTAVYFKTTAGIIQPSAITDKDGTATASLISSNPRPAGGIVTITATTIGDSGKIVSKSGQVIFSGAAIVTLPVGNFTVPDSGSYTFNYRVSDASGNPVVSGSTIAVSVSGPGSGDIQLTGDANVTVPDAGAPGVGATLFQVTLTDKSRGGPSGLVNVTVKVSSDPATGNGSATSTFSGIQIGSAGGSLGAALASSISLSAISPSSGDLSVRGTGSNESARLTFTVRDSSGNPAVDPLGIAPKIYVVFSASPNLSGGEFIFPTGDSTNSLGQVSTTFNAGTRSGVIQVTAQTVSGARVIVAAPVAITISGGLPDPGHFTPTLSKINMPGLIKTGPLGTVNVLVGDSAGNPVQSGTKLYFSTSGGVITAQANTDGGGQANATLQGGLPAPNNGGPGLGLVSVSTVGKGGALITRQLPFLFSGSPLIFAPGSGFQIADSGQYNFSYKVADANGNPIAGGGNIQVTASGPGAGALSLKGDVNKVMPDTKDTSATDFSVQVQDNSGPAGAVTMTISVTGDNGTASYSWNGTKYAKGAVIGVSGSGAGYAQSIQLGTVNPPAPGPISVKGTGASETASMTFQVRDSLGNSLDPSRAVTVTFTIQNGPGGGEFLYPASAVTNASGTVSTTLNAGTKSGVVQVIAQTTVGAVTITSSPVQMTIANGLADPAHFTLLSSVGNGALTSQNAGTAIATFGVQIGDKYGNPAQGSAVYFTSNGGVISPSAFTDNTGHAAGITLYAGNPFPSGGIDTVTAITQGDNGANITTRAILTLSGSAIITAPASLSTVADGGFIYLNFDVKDANSNPLAAKNAITVTLTGDAAGQLAMSGNTNVTTVDTRDTSTVHYQVRIADATPNGGTGGNFSAVISVVGPNTPVSGISKTIGGFLQAPGVVVGSGGGGTGYTSSIILSSVSATDISVQGTGSAETATLVFQARDSLGQVIDVAHGSMMHFMISPPTLGAVLTIDSAQTDAAGRSTTLVRSGTHAGVIQVTASVTVPTGQKITSLPVRLSINSGLPDQNHFTIGAQKLNFPGLNFNGLTDDITIQMGDQFGNPVQIGTVAYFTTNHGIIETQGSTSSSDGFISKNLFSANPRPQGAFAIPAGNGWSYVTVSTFGSAGNVVADSVRLLWTGPPVITRTSGISNFSVPKGGTVGPWTFTVTDVYNHPLSSGTSISASAVGGVVSGNAGVTLPDVQFGGAGITSFTITLTNSDPATGVNPPSASQLIVTVTHPVYGTFSVILDSGTMQ